MDLLKRRIKLVIIALGIIITYSSMGIVVEKLFKGDYEKDGKKEKFNFAVAYSMVQCITPTIISKVVMVVTDHPKNETPQKYYILVAIFHFLGGVTSKMALEYISYPVHVIGKACTPIPVMICGVLIARKSHTWQRYIFVIMIVSGIALFVFKDNAAKKEHELEYLGNILIGISLLTDGFKGAAQDVMRKVARPTPLNFMFFENLYSFLILLGILIVGGEGIKFIEFCMRHQEVWVYLSLVMLCATIGQFFISQMVSHFGSLPLVITTTLRKFFTVLFSVFIFNHNLTVRQWTATGMIFGGLFLDVLFGKKRCASDDDEDESSEEAEDLKEKDKSMKLRNKVGIEPTV